MLNKRGQELTTGTIILIVLGAILLVFLIYGFSVGWGNFWNTLVGIVGGGSDIDSIKAQCKVNCAQKEQDQFNKYNLERKKYTLTKGVNIDVSCLAMESKYPFASEQIGKCVALVGGNLYAVKDATQDNCKDVKYSTTGNKCRSNNADVGLFDSNNVVVSNVPISQGDCKAFWIPTNALGDWKEKGLLGAC